MMPSSSRPLAFRSVATAAILLLSAACADSTPVGPEDGSLARGGNPNAGNPTQPGGSAATTDVIVVLGDGDDPNAVARSHAVKADRIFNHVFKGFSSSLPEAAKAGLLKDGRVRRIVPDQAFSIDEETTPAASWGLDRIDQRLGELDATYRYMATGAGVTAYIVDTGIRFSHDDFGGRAVPGFDAFSEGGADCHGHGTHVAGTVGGSVYGVAKEVSLVAVRVLNCKGSGTTGSILSGLDWILANAARPGVVNMSLGGPVDDVVDAAVARIIESGISVVVAAGNRGANACNYSPARVPGALTLGGTSENDVRASWSNWGPCVDLFAPGASITSAGHGDDGATAVKSGTSMAAPHAVGAVALYLETRPGAAPSEVSEALASMSTKGVVASSFSPSSDLLYSVDDGDDGSMGNEAPVAQFSFECEGLSCQFTDESSDPDGSLVGWQWVFGDGTGALTQSPSHTFSAAGTYDVMLIVRDNQGRTTPQTQEVTVSAGASQPPPPENASPVASFAVQCARLSCQFQNLSRDPDGTIAKSTWEFGDGSTSVLQAASNAGHEFPAAGTYRVTLAVIDNDGALASAVQQVEVGLSLTVVGSKDKGRHVLDLRWTGAETPDVAIHISGFPVLTAANTGSFRFETGGRGTGSYLVKVCETGASGLCSAEKTVSF